MAIANFDQFPRKANDTIALSQLKSLMTAQQAFMADHPRVAS